MRRALCILVALLVIGGCSGDPSPGPSQANASRANADDELRAWMTKIGRCLTDAGFPAVPVPDGDGLELPQVGADQEQALREAMAQCHVEHGETPPGSEPLTVVEVGVLYELFVQQSECLERNGYPVEELPSRDTWVAAYQAGGDEAVLPMGRQLDVGAAEAACPSPTPQDIYERMAADS